MRSPERARLRPCDVVCVIDTSGSMQLPAMVKTAEGESSDGDGLDRLDLVKHAVHVITNTLSPADRLAVVSYNDVVAVDLGLTQMNPVRRFDPPPKPPKPPYTNSAWRRSNEIRPLSPFWRKERYLPKRLTFDTRVFPAREQR